MPVESPANGPKHRLASCFAPCGCRDDAPWFVAHTLPQSESLALLSLIGAGLIAWLPQHSVEWANRQRRVTPLFPRYIFFQPDISGQWGAAFRARGVSTVLCRADGLPARVPISAMTALFAQCADDGVIYPPSPRRMRRDDLGRVVDGPLAEFSGVCSRATDERVWLLLEIMGRVTEVGFARAAVEAVA